MEVMDNSLSGTKLPKQKVLYIIDHLRGDGTQVFLQNLILELSTRGYLQHVISLSRSSHSHVLGTLSGKCSISFIGKSSLLTGVGIFRLIHEIQRERFDTVVTMLFFSDVIGSLAAHAAGCPNIVSAIRARNIHYSWFGRLLSRMAHRYSTHITLHSTAIANHILESEYIPKSKISIIPNAIVIPQRSGYTHDELIGEFNLDPSSFIFLSVGRLEPQKGLDLAIAALSSLENFNFVWLVVGEGREKQRLNELAQKHGIGERVQFVGYRALAFRLMSGCDCYIHPSRFEGMSHSLLEALAVAPRVISSDIAENADVIKEYKREHVYMFHSEDVGDLQSQLRKALNSPKSNVLMTSDSGIPTIQIVADLWERLFKLPPPSQKEKHPK